MIRPEASQRRSRSEHLSELTITERKYQKAKRKRDTCIYVLTGMCIVFTLLTALLAFLLYIVTRRLVQVDPNLSFLMSNSTLVSAPPNYTINYDEIPKEDPKSCKTFRLSPDVLPFKYDIIMNFDLDANSFKGRSSILINVTNPVKEIRIHGKFLSFQNVELLELAGFQENVSNSSVVGNNNAKRTSVNSFYEVKSCEMWVLSLKKQLNPGRYELIIVFSSSAERPEYNIVGLYQSKYSRGNITR